MAPPNAAGEQSPIAAKPSTHLTAHQPVASSAPPQRARSILSILSQVDPDPSPRTTHEIENELTHMITETMSEKSVESGGPVVSPVVNPLKFMRLHTAPITGTEDHREPAEALWASVLPSLVASDYAHPENVTYFDKQPAGRRYSSWRSPAKDSHPTTGLLPPSFVDAPPPPSSPKARLGYVRLHPSKELAVISALDPESVEATVRITEMLSLRQKFIPEFPDVDSPCVIPKIVPSERLGFESTEPSFDIDRAKILPTIDASIEMIDGVFHVYWKPPYAFTGRSVVTASSSAPPTVAAPDKEERHPLLWEARPIPSVAQFLSALHTLMNVVQQPECKTFCYKRLRYLKKKFSLHLMFNGTAELQEVQNNRHRDFYNVRKVDTHIHHSACMRQKHLLRFIRSKCRREPDVVVKLDEDALEVTLKDLFARTLGLTAHELSVDTLNVHALGSCFHRFDIFSNKYNPFGQQELRELFLKTDNYMNGRYLADITKEVMSDLEDGKYQFVEWRISIYGKSPDEWTRLGQWFSKHKVHSKQVRWMIQVPRLYKVYRQRGIIKCFGDMLRNIFSPLFQVVIDPASDPDVFRLLHQVVGFDSVDDESIMSKFSSSGGGMLPRPDEWTSDLSPPYSYWAYYMYANVRALNELLSARGMRTMPFRPHCGEAGNVSHLASMFLLADGINHGIMLRKMPVLQYLYYLKQIPLAMSPLSNNALFHQIGRSPFPLFFYLGLNVSLSTDDPLMFHFTDEPLLEEYSCCAHIWKLSTVDLCEIARNSVLQSNFEPLLKAHWVGKDYKKDGSAGNDISRTNVSGIRMSYRRDTLCEEFTLLRDAVKSNLSERH